MQLIWRPRAAAIVVLAGMAGIVACEASQDFEFNPPASTFTAESVQVNGEAAKVLVAHIDAGFFASSPRPLAPLLGRSLMADEYGGAGNVALASETWWRTQMGARPDVIGSTLQLDSTPVTLVGIMPAGVDVPAGVALWIARD